MPRKPRMYLPGMPCHIIQRGNNREATFFADQDYLFYLECLYDASIRYGVSIHAYVLMTNHVHLLMTPHTKDSISLLMQSLGRRYVQYVNQEYRRTGTLWEGRHKASLVDADNYLLICSRYIEMNPVSANMVKNPSEYRWSSFMYNAHGKPDKLICSHNIYNGLGTNNAARQEAYRLLFNIVIDDAKIKLIRNATKFSMLTGDSRFKEQVECALNRKIGQDYRGRPRARMTSM